MYHDHDKSVDSSQSNVQVEYEFSPGTVQVAPSLPLTRGNIYSIESCDIWVEGLDGKNSFTWSTHEATSGGDILIADGLVWLSWDDWSTDCWCSEVPFVTFTLLAFDN